MNIMLKSRAAVKVALFLENIETIRYIINISRLIKHELVRLPYIIPEKLLISEMPPTKKISISLSANMDMI